MTFVRLSGRFGRAFGPVRFLPGEGDRETTLSESWSGLSNGSPTDGTMAYPLAVSKEFGKTGGRKGYANPHRRVPSIRATQSNNRIERLRGPEKERMEVSAFDTDRRGGDDRGGLPCPL